MGSSMPGSEVEPTHVMCWLGSSSLGFESASIMILGAYGDTFNDVPLVAAAVESPFPLRTSSVGTWLTFRYRGMQTCARASVSTSRLITRDVLSLIILFPIKLAGDSFGLAFRGLDALQESGKARTWAAALEVNEAKEPSKIDVLESHEQ